MGNMIRRAINKYTIVCLIAASAFCIGSARGQDHFQPVTLVDYATFPSKWKIRGEVERLHKIYQVKIEGEERILSAKVSGVPIRIFKKVSWNPFTHPVLAWRWRVHQWPEDPEASIDLYVSIYRDLMGIPTFIKYQWSRSLPVDTVIEGGFFRPSEVVIRSGLSDAGEWVTEEIDVLKGFRFIHETDPDPEAYGIGLLVSPGVEMEISRIVARPE
jgi:hypothetical protein